MINFFIFNLGDTAVGVVDMVIAIAQRYRKKMG
jgi:hypothetical protein